MPRVLIAPPIVLAQLVFLQKLIRWGRRRDLSLLDLTLKSRYDNYCYIGEAANAQQAIRPENGARPLRLRLSCFNQAARRDRYGLLVEV